MKLQKSNDITSEPADPKTFMGNASLQRLLLEPTLKVYRVVFEPGARMNWHRHDGIQLLVILEGVCWVQKRSEAKQEARAGDVVMIQPGEEHWHGASHSEGMVHLAINLGSKTTWGDWVLDEDYSS